MAEPVAEFSRNVRAPTRMASQVFWARQGLLNVLDRSIPGYSHETRTSSRATRGVSDRARQQILVNALG